jgi:hypothetical protein
MDGSERTTRENLKKLSNRRCSPPYSYPQSPQSPQSPFLTCVDTVRPEGLIQPSSQKDGFVVQTRTGNGVLVLAQARRDRCDAYLSEG